MEDTVKTERPEEETITLGQDRVGKDHIFRLKRDRDGMMVAQCDLCPLGFPADGIEIKNGHIFKGGEQII